MKDESDEGEVEYARREKRERFPNYLCRADPNRVRGRNERKYTVRAIKLEDQREKTAIFLERKS